MPFSTTSPLTGEPLAPVEATPVGSVAQLVSRAREAQAAWASKPLEARMEAIYRVKDRILDAGEEIARVLRTECGKPEGEAWTAEVIPNADLVEHWIEGIEEALAPEEVSLDPMTYPGKSGAIHAVPRGVIALITPWNFPVAIPLRTIVPALLAGNAIVFKPSEHSPRAGALVAKLFEGLLPPDVFVLVQGGGDVGAALVSSGPDLIVFTGSVPTGRKIAEAAARALTPVSLELGGKDAAIVLDDADVERAARGIVWGAFNNAGQNCASIERVYVHEKIAGALVDRMVALTRQLRVGEDVGPLTTQQQLEVVQRHVDGARELGAEVLCGGKATGRGLLFEPTIVKVTGDEGRIPLMTDETFGPVLPVVIVKSEDEAIRRANDSRYGLTASVWTKKTSRGEQLAERLRAGVVTVNNHGFTAAIAAAPWSGVGESGFGVTNSKHALREFTRPRFVLVDKSSAKSELWWMPYTPSLVATVKAMSILRSASRSIGEKLRALIMLLSNAPKRLMGR
ncbi:MAG: aldehyde dehydrogenase family protein [Deltaproteobacteria bacterium]|nr:aldehyde dehydrogenase family protein [Deltaproteobacteria bacterium]